MITTKVFYFVHFPVISWEINREISQSKGLVTMGILL